MEEQIETLRLGRDECQDRRKHKQRWLEPKKEREVYEVKSDEVESFWHQFVDNVSYVSGSDSSYETVPLSSYAFVAGLLSACVINLSLFG